MCSKKDSFSTDTFVNKIIFVEEDFILMELDQSNEIIFHVESGRTISSFNSISSNFKFNEKFFPEKFQLQIAKQINKYARETSLQRSRTEWVNPRDQNQPQFLPALGSRPEFMVPSKDPKRKRSAQDAMKNIMLEDFRYLNMKRVRHIHFFEQQALCSVIRDIQMNSSEI